jgi:Domain of unknown function (DUF4410)
MFLRYTLSLLFPMLIISLLSGCKSNLSTLNSEWPAADQCQIYQESVRLWIDPSVFNEEDFYAEEMEEMEEEGDIDWSADESLQPIAFIVAEPEWLVEDSLSDDPVKDAERKEDLVFTVRERLYRYLLRTYPHPVRVRYAYTKEDKKLHGDRLITVTSQITDITKGNGMLRYMVGYGAGRVGLQVEGKIYDGTSEEGTKIGQFAIRRSHGGFAQNGFNLDVFRDDYCLRYAAEEMVTDLTEDLSEYIPGLDELDEKGESVDPVEADELEIIAFCNKE